MRNVNGNAGNAKMDENATNLVKAYHEAGHAVAVWSKNFDWVLESVSLESRAAYRPKLSNKFRNKKHNPYKVVDYLVDVPFFGFAGDGAVRILKGKSYDPSTDRCDTNDDIADVNAKIKQCWKDADGFDLGALLEEFLARPPFWACVEAVANALLERGELTGRQAYRICNNTFQAANNSMPIEDIEN